VPQFLFTSFQNTETERLKVFQFTLSWTVVELGQNGLHTYSIDRKSYWAT